jgi:hypothetical protein
MRRTSSLALLLTCVSLAGCSGGTKLLGSSPQVGLQAKTPQAAQKLGFPSVATKNTTRVGGGDPIVDAAAVALAVYPSAQTGTHPPAVAVAPAGDWQAALATASLMAPPFRVPLVLSNPGSVPSATFDALGVLAPPGSRRLHGTQLIKIGSVDVPGGYKTATIPGADGIALAAAIDAFETSARGDASRTVVIASADEPAYAMPAAAWAAESGEPILYVTSSGVPEATRKALMTHQTPRMYLLGPPSVIPNSVAHTLASFGSVKRVGAEGAAANSVAFTVYRDPACAVNQPCAHVPHSFGWAMRSPGHGYVLANSHRPLDAAAAAALSSSGSYGPLLLVDDPSTLPKPVLDYFLNYATPGSGIDGPTAAVYNHGWIIGDTGAVSLGVQGQLDSLLEVVPQGSAG